MGLLHTILTGDKMENWFVCDLCGDTFRKKAHIESHLLQLHLKQKVNCSTCNQYFHPEALRRHHQKCINLPKHEIQCNVCSKFFSRLEHLRTHEKNVHLKEKVVCIFCQKSINENYLKTHQKKKCKKVLTLEAKTVAELENDVWCIEYESENNY